MVCVSRASLIRPENPSYTRSSNDPDEPFNDIVEKTNPKLDDIRADQFDLAARLAPP